MLTSCWQRADGKTAQFLVNWTKEDIVCRVNGREIVIHAADVAMTEEEP